MPIKQFNTRIQHKTSTKESLIGSGFIPVKGEIVIGGNIHESGLTNISADPFVAKIGDGIGEWDDLPPIGVPKTFTEPNLVINDGNETDDLNVILSIPPNEKTYATYHLLQNSDDASFTLTITGGDYMLTEHYLLFDNREGTDKFLSGVIVEGVESENIFIQKDYISNGDIVQLNIMFYKINGNLCCTITETPGLVNGGQF